MHIGLNAHLLSRRKGYRAAGIHGYIYHTLTHLAAVAPDDWRFTVLLGGGNPHTFPGLDARRASFATDSPLARIVWEQTIQPVALRQFDLYHALAFVSPVIQPAPGVVTIYDLSFIHYPQVLSAARRAYLRAFTAWSCRRARRVIAISHSTAQDVRQTLGIPAEKIDVAPAGYNQTRFYPHPPEQIAAFRTAHDLPDDFLLFVGTLEPRKNLTTLLDAYAQIPAENRLPLVLAGGKGWDYAPIFERIAQYKLDVRLPGFLPAEDLPLWYNSATAFVYPSVFEGFGLPVLEAMACGTPVVISDASSLPEVAGKAGLCVPPHDVLAWVNALEQAMHDRQWRADAARRGLTEASRYDWRETARQTIASYQRAL